MIILERNSLGFIELKLNFNLNQLYFTLHCAEGISQISFTLSPAKVNF